MNRRAFIAGLFATSVAVHLPPGAATPEDLKDDETTPTLELLLQDWERYWGWRPIEGTESYIWCWLVAAQIDEVNGQIEMAYSHV